MGRTLELSHVSTTWDYQIVFKAEKLWLGVRTLPPPVRIVRVIQSQKLLQISLLVPRISEKEYCSSEMFWLNISYQKMKWGNLGPEAPTLGIATMLKWNVVKPMGCRPEKLALRGVYAAMLTLGLKNSRVKAPFSHKWQNLRQRRWSRNMEATSKSPKLSNIVARCNLLSWGGCTARRWAQCCHQAGKLNATNKAATLQRN